MSSFNAKWSMPIVIGIGLILALPLFWCGFPDPTHDGRFHVQWIECFSSQFWKGDFYPRWLTSPNSGFGAATFYFYAPVPYFVGALIWGVCSLLGETSLALGWTAALGLILSGVAALHCMRRYAETEWVAVLGAVLYMIAPYHLAIDLLDRGANAEFWAFVWLPWIVCCIEDLGLLTKNHQSTNETSRHIRIPSVDEIRKILLLGIAIGGLLTTHLPTAVIFAPIVIGLALCRGLQTGINVAIAGLLSICLAAAYIFPAYFYGPYTVGPSIGWICGSDIGNSVFFPSLNLNEPLFNDDPYNRRLLYILIHFAIIWGIALITVFFVAKSHKARFDIIIWGVVLYSCFIMMSPVALPIYEHVAALRHIQFSWRFMACATLAATILATVIIQEFWTNRDYSPMMRSLGRVAAAAIIITFVGASLEHGIPKYSEAFLREDGSIRNPMWGDINAPDAYGEHDPVAANLAEAKASFPNTGKKQLNPKLLTGKGEVTLIQSKPRCWKMNVESETNGVIIIPQYWFPGWIAKDGTGNSFPTRANQKSGLIEIEIPSGNYSLTASMQMLWPERIGDATSLLTILIVGVMLFGSRRFLRTKIIKPSFGA